MPSIISYFHGNCLRHNAHPRIGLRCACGRHLQRLAHRRACTPVTSARSRSLSSSDYAHSLALAITRCHSASDLHLRTNIARKRPRVADYCTDTPSSYATASINCVGLTIVRQSIRFFAHTHTVCTAKSSYHTWQWHSPRPGPAIKHDALALAPWHTYTLIILCTITPSLAFNLRRPTVPFRPCGPIYVRKMSSEGVDRLAS